MMGFFAWIWDWITWLFAALIPFKPGRGLSPAVRWFLWILLDLTFLGVLFLINYFADFGQAVDRIPRLVNIPGVREVLRQIWLPILGQLIVFMGIALYWFYLVWFAEMEDSPFPDIEAAWQEAMRSLEHAGIALPKVPLFLVLGRPESPEEHLFEASGMKLVFPQTPANPFAPVHVFADRNAVFVTCRGASVLGRLAEILALENMPEGASALDQESTEELDKTMRPGSKEQVVIEMLRAPAGQATPPRRRALRRAVLGKPLGSDFLSDPKEVGKFKARLAYLCRLIVRDRQPHCPANGILLLVPLGGTDTSGEAQFTAQAAQEDLSVARQEMKLDCPVVTLLVDMEHLPGFADFLQRQPSKELGNRHGNGFPMATRLSREELVDQVRMSLAWVCTTYIQDSVYRLFQGETPANKDPGPLFPGNARMVLLLDEMNERAEALSWIISRAIAPEEDAMFRYSGCYLAATGPKGSQGFIAGVFQKMVKEQSAVGWTDAALHEDAQFHTWAKCYLVLAIVLALAWCALLAWIIIR